MVRDRDLFREGKGKKVGDRGRSKNIIYSCGRYNDFISRNNPRHIRHKELRGVTNIYKAVGLFERHKFSPTLGMDGEGRKTVPGRVVNLIKVADKNNLG